MDLHLLDECIEEAIRGHRNGDGGPFGALIVKDGKVVGRGHNTVLLDRDPTCHAEINAIRDACRTLGQHDLSQCVLISSSEPCPMCTGALKWAGISTFYIGVDKNMAAEYGFSDVRFESDEGLTKHFGPIITRSKIRRMFDEWEMSDGKLY
jgi:tRNA(Arg) A34 adenosine deaminase TadA